MQDIFIEKMPSEKLISDYPIRNRDGVPMITVYIHRYLVI